MIASALPNQSGLTSTALTVETSQRGSIRFAPTGGWGTATQHEFVVGESGPPAGIVKYPSYLQGTSKRNMTPKPLTFQVSYVQPGTFSVSVAQVAKQGAHLKVAVDGKAVERDYPAGNADYNPKEGEAVLKVEVPEGAHTLTIENTGVDWVLLGPLSFSNYAPVLAAPARVGKEYAVVWLYHRDNVDAPSAKEKELQPATGRLRLVGMKPGKYRATWWDTREGKSLDATEVTVGKEKENGKESKESKESRDKAAEKEPFALLTTPPIVRDVALYITRAEAVPNDTAKAKNDKKEKSP